MLRGAWLAVLLFAALRLTARADDTTRVVQTLPPLRLGHPLYLASLDSSSGSRLTSGSVFELTALARERINLRHSADLLAMDVRFFQPDLVSDGSEVILSALGGGLNSVRLISDGHLLRNPRNCRPDFNSLAPLFVSSARSVATGSLDGVNAIGGVVALDPLDLYFSEPITEFAYREGYYDYSPLEFLHARPLAAQTFLSAGGYMPSSNSRFENAEHHGHNFLFGLNHRFRPSLSAGLRWQKRYDQTDLAFTENQRRLWDDDLTGNIRWTKGDVEAEYFGFRAERVEKEDVFRAHYRESGGGVSARLGALGLCLRSAAVDLDMQQDQRLRLTDFEGSLGAAIPLSWIKLSATIGGSGWYPDRVGLTGDVSLEADLPWQNLGLFGSISRSVDPHSPETMFAHYTGESRPADALDPVWNLRPELQIQGAALPITRSLGGELGLRKSFPLGFKPVEIGGARVTKALKTFFLDGMAEEGELSLESAYFNRRETTPWHWTVHGDTIITPKTISDRTIDGWRASAAWNQRPFSASLSLISLNRVQQLEHGVPSAFPEPTFRLRWMAGWRKSFDNGNVEADVSFSGAYFNGYYTYRAEGWHLLGGAYPLDFKTSLRIKRFTIYWGLHNWNSYQYYLVPGHKMMHKEEYFGLNWLLVN